MSISASPVTWLAELQHERSANPRHGRRDGDEDERRAGEVLQQNDVVIVAVDVVNVVVAIGNVVGRRTLTSLTTSSFLSTRRKWKFKFWMGKYFTGKNNLFCREEDYFSVTLHWGVVRDRYKQKIDFANWKKAGTSEIWMTMHFSKNMEW